FDSMYAAVAVITLMPPGSDTLAVADEAASAPASGVLCTVDATPEAGVTVTATTVPSGMCAAVTATVTVPDWPDRTTISGFACNEPRGEAGAAIPATDAIRSCGRFGSDTGLGVEVRSAEAGSAVG